MWKLYANDFGGCLADDMGLGKTLQTLTLMQQVINDEKKRSCGPANSNIRQAAHHIRFGQMPHR